MTNLKDYTTLIRAYVRELTKKDPNYRWAVKAINKGEIKITWSYLDEGDGYFSVKVLQDGPNHDDLMMIPPHASSDDVTFVMVGRGSWCDAPSFTIGIKRAIESAYFYAHHYY